MASESRNFSVSRSISTLEKREQKEDELNYVLMLRFEIRSFDKSSLEPDDDHISMKIHHWGLKKKKERRSFCCP